jgi:hypothetical protein
LNSIDNFFNKADLQRAAGAEAWSLVFVGVHMAAISIGTGLFSDQQLTGLKAFLKRFVDLEDEGSNFSAVAAEIHEMRHVFAHRWLSRKLYKVGLDINTTAGWIREDDGTIFVNPKLLYDAYQEPFGAGGRVWEWSQLMTESEQLAAKDRLLKRFER